MLPVHDITVPETKPATEYYFGRFIQKVSAQRRHAVAQVRIGAALLRWADDHGEGMAATEWDFHIAPPGEPMNVLVPDVAYLRYDRMRSPDDPESEQISYVAADAVFEVLSRGNTRAEIEEKKRVFLACGTQVFAVADPVKRTLTVYDRTGMNVLNDTQTFTHAALPHLALPVADIFREALRR